MAGAVGSRSLVAALAGAVLVSLGAIALIGHQAASQTGAAVVVSPPLATTAPACVLPSLGREGMALGRECSPGVGVLFLVAPTALIARRHQLFCPAQLTFPPHSPQSAGLRSAGGAAAADHGAYSCVEAAPESGARVLSGQVSRQPGALYTGCSSGKIPPAHQPTRSS
jgi:hypothetical protein